VMDRHLQALPQQIRIAELAPAMQPHFTGARHITPFVGKADQAFVDQPDPLAGL